MAEAHRAGIVHRDIKPENVLLAGDGRAILADFGVAFYDSGERHTLLDEAVGAQNFIAPELEDGRATDVTTAADVYSLGKLLYWIMSDGRVFSREKHRVGTFSLASPRDKMLWDRIGMEHINELVDRMITV